VATVQKKWWNDMGFICKTCGNTDRFNGQQNETQYVSQTVFLDGDGEVYDYGDSETNDSEVTDGPDDVECSECGSDDVVWIEDEEEFKKIEEEIIKRKEMENKIQNWKKRIQ